MKELTSSTGGVSGLNWYASGSTYPGTYYHDFLPDIIDHREYSWFLYTITLDTTGVWGNYPKSITVQPNNDHLNSNYTTTVLYRRFQANETISFTLLLYSECSMNSSYTQDYGATDVCTATIISNSILEAFISGYNTIFNYQLADVIDSSVPLSRSTNTGLKYIFNFNSAVNYDQSYSVSYRLYGII